MNVGTHKIIWENTWKMILWLFYKIIIWKSHESYISYIPYDPFCYYTFFNGIVISIGFKWKYMGKDLNLVCKYAYKNIKEISSYDRAEKKLSFKSGKI